MTPEPRDATPGLTPELEDAIQLGYAQRDRANMAPTIAYFESLLAKNPDHPVLVYEVAGAYDTSGQEEKARGLYERALELGLAGDARRRCLCQYGSTLRWLEQYDKSLAVLDQARQGWPESDAVRVFRALTLNDAGRGDEAVAELLTVITSHGEVTDLGRWAEGLRGLAQWLADGRPDDLLSRIQLGRPAGKFKFKKMAPRRNLLHFANSLQSKALAKCNLSVAFRSAQSPELRYGSVHGKSWATARANRRPGKQVPTPCLPARRDNR